MALKRTAEPRIDVNAVSFPRMIFLSRGQPEFKACAWEGGSGNSWAEEVARSSQAGSQQHTSWSPALSPK